jgi:hypothetical protein
MFNSWLDHPLLVLLVSFCLLRAATSAGASLVHVRGQVETEFRADFSTILTATLTLLALLIGFCFSMAISRYDQRKNLEEAEANAIGTEYLRADLLADGDAAKVHGLLRNYLDQRILFYNTRDAEQRRLIATRTGELQNAMWSAVLPTVRAQPTPPVALAVAGMNDVLNSEGYTQAAWWNRIPASAWALMLAMATAGNALIGYGAHNARRSRYLLTVLPALVSVAFFLIADIDSPHGGVIHVQPQNLHRLVGILPPP